MTNPNGISSSKYQKIILQHSHFLLARALDSFKLQHYNLAVFFAITAIEEVTNNLYNLTGKDEKLDIENFIKDFFPLASQVLKDDMKNKEKIDLKLNEITEKYFKDIKTPLTLSIKELSSKFRMKEHKSHNKKTLKALVNSLSINLRAYQILGSGFIDFYIYLAKSGMIFKLRNLCLYVNVKKGLISNPEEIIPKSMAVDFIAIAFETIIELRNIGRQYFSKEEAVFLDEMNLLEKADEFYKINELKPITFVGTITDFLNKKNVIIVNVTNKVSLNDDLVIYNSQWKHFDKALSIEKDNQRVTKALVGDEVGIKIKNKTSRRGLLFKVQKDVRQTQKEGAIQLMDAVMESIKNGQTLDDDKVREILNKSLKGIS
jgi:hypothetical protein